MNDDAHHELDTLMARLADGDRSVFARVFELLFQPVQRFCGHLLKHEADAADATQEAMQKIFERASDYDKRRRALPWAMAIAGWECRTILRKRSRRHEVSDEILGDRSSSDVDVEETFVRRNLTEAALSALGQLDDVDRETILATFWEEAASAKGATLRKRRARALERLRIHFRRLYAVD